MHGTIVWTMDIFQTCRRATRFQKVFILCSLISAFAIPDNFSTRWKHWNMVMGILKKLKGGTFYFSTLFPLKQSQFSQRCVAHFPHVWFCQQEERGLKNDFFLFSSLQTSDNELVVWNLLQVYNFVCGNFHRKHTFNFVKRMTKKAH